MIERLLKARIPGLEIYHVRMVFSETSEAVGKFRFRKLYHLFQIISRTYHLKFRFGIKKLYYLPSGPNLNPIIRDIIILIFVRPLFQRTILHFRASGISDYLKNKNIFIRTLLSFPYRYPDIGIQLSSLNPADATYFNARNIFYVPNGIEDDFNPAARVNKNQRNVKEILFVGNVSLSIRGRAACRASGGIHRYGYVLPVPANAGIQRPPPDRI